MHRVDRESAGGRWSQGRHEVGRGDRDEALDAGGNPDDADAAQELFGGDAEARKGQAIERMGGIGDLDLLGWGDADANRGSVLCGSSTILGSKL